DLLVHGSTTGSGDARFSRRVGIGQSADPNHALSFTDTTGNKIALYPVSSTTAYGFGIKTSQLAYYVNANNARHAFGYGDADNFNEFARISSGGIESVYNLNVGGSITGSGGLTVAGSLTAGSIPALSTAYTSLQTGITASINSSTS